MMLLGLMSFDVPMNELLLMHRCQPGGHLRRDFQRQLYLQWAGAFDEILERLSLYKLHRIEVISAATAQVEHRSDVRVTDAGRRASFAQEAEAGRLIPKVSFIDDFQCHRAA
jgi:hypothetical protein